MSTFTWSETSERLHCSRHNLWMKRSYFHHDATSRSIDSLYQVAMYGLQSSDDKLRQLTLPSQLLPTDHMYGEAKKVHLKILLNYHQCFCFLFLLESQVYSFKDGQHRDQSAFCCKCKHTDSRTKFARQWGRRLLMFGKSGELLHHNLRHIHLLFRCMQRLKRHTFTGKWREFPANVRIDYLWNSRWTLSLWFFISKFKSISKYFKNKHQICSRVESVEYHVEITS